MRNPLDFALGACRCNHEAWTAERFASGKVEFAGDYILVVTNLSPFFTLNSWLSQSGTEKLLELRPPETHLRALTSKIGNIVDLWVGHGAGFLFSVFQGLAESLEWHRWLLTYNLSGLGLANMHKAARNKDHPLHQLYVCNRTNPQLDS